MKSLEAKDKAGKILDFFNTKVYNTQDWKNVKDKSVNAVSSSAAYEEYKENEVIPFNALKYAEAKKTITLSEPMDFVEESNLEDTMFGKTFLGSADNVFTNNTMQNNIENFDQSVIISRDALFNAQPEIAKEKVKEELSNLDMESLDKLSKGETIEEVEDVNKEITSEEMSLEEPAKVKTLKPNKKAAYVDTVILCLIAQLSIFGILIIVLLVIK